MGGKTIQALAHWYWYKSHIVISTGPAWQPCSFSCLCRAWIFSSVFSSIILIFSYLPHPSLWLWRPSDLADPCRWMKNTPGDERWPFRSYTQLSGQFLPLPLTAGSLHTNTAIKAPVTIGTMSCSLLYSVDFFHFTVTSYFKHPHSHVSFLNIVQIEVNDFSAVWGKDFLIFSVCTLCVFGHFVVYECGKHLNTQTAKDAVLCPFWWVDFSDECSLNRGVKLKGHTQKWESHLAFPQNVVDFCPDKTHIQAS